MAEAAAVARALAQTTAFANDCIIALVFVISKEEGQLEKMEPAVYSKWSERDLSFASGSKGKARH